MLDTRAGISASLVFFLLSIAGDSPLFPSDLNRSGHQTTFKTVWHKTLRRAKVPYFRIYDLRSSYATRLNAGGVADEW